MVQRRTIFQPGNFVCSRSATSGSSLGCCCYTPSWRWLQCWPFSCLKKLKRGWSGLLNARGGRKLTAPDTRSLSTSKTLKMWRLPTSDSRIFRLERRGRFLCRGSFVSTASIAKILRRQRIENGEMARVKFDGQILPLPASEKDFLQ